MATKETNNKANTSKTARVMNLLSKSREPSPDGETPSPSPEAVPTANAQPLPPILSALAPDAAVSVQIKSALEEALEDELSVSPPEPWEAPFSAPVSEPHEPEAPPPPAPQSATPAAGPSEFPLSPSIRDENPPLSPSEVALPDEEAAPQTQAPESEASFPVEEAPPPAEPKQEAQGADTAYVNVIQALVEEKASKYIQLFGLCQCPRCEMDVKALALNNLPPKYVVMHQGEKIPRLTLYEGRYNTAVTAQLLRACKTVMETPRHDG